MIFKKYSIKLKKKKNNQVQTISNMHVFSVNIHMHTSVYTNIHTSVSE